MVVSHAVCAPGTFLPECGPIWAVFSTFICFIHSAVCCVTYVLAQPPPQGKKQRRAHTHTCIRYTYIRTHIYIYLHSSRETLSRKHTHTPTKRYVPTLPSPTQHKRLLSFDTHTHARAQGVNNPAAA